MPYFERDEARHVGLGVLYLPRLLAKLGPLEAARLKLLPAQDRHAHRLGHAPQDARTSTRSASTTTTAFRRGMRLNREVMSGMRTPDGDEPPGVLVGSRELDRINDWRSISSSRASGATPPRVAARDHRRRRGAQPRRRSRAAAGGVTDVMKKALRHASWPPACSWCACCIARRSWRSCSSPSVAPRSARPSRRRRSATPPHNRLFLHF